MIFFYLFSVCITQVACLGQFGDFFPLPKNWLKVLTEAIPSELMDALDVDDLLIDYLPGTFENIVQQNLSLFTNMRFQRETLMDTEELVEFQGYPIETHTVTTEDGYILTLHRIPGNKTHKYNINLSPIFIVHGTLGNGGSFFSNTPENCFPYLLANAGFDVWLANHRGTKYSLKHVLADPDIYWKFSSDEIAKFDMPANIDYILNVTGHPQLFFSGHSIGGGTIPFAFLAERPEYMSKVKAIYGLAPSSNFANVSDGLMSLAKLAPLLKLFAKVSKIDYVPDIHQLIRGFVGKYYEPIVQAVVFYLMGRNHQDWNSILTEVHMAHYFSSSSKYILIHEAQLIKKNGFRKCDWGAAINKQKYGRTTPPDYNISKINIPCYFFVANNDGFIPINNAQYLKDRLPNATISQAGEFWNHLDFLWAKNAGIFHRKLVSRILAFR